MRLRYQRFSLPLAKAGRIVDSQAKTNAHSELQGCGTATKGCETAEISLRAKECFVMNLTISGHHLEVTPSLRSYVMAKLERILRHFDQVVDVKVLLTVHKQKEKDKR